MQVAQNLMRSARRPRANADQNGQPTPASGQMSTKSAVWIAVAGIAFVFFCVGAAWLALRLIASNRAAVIATLPVKPEQTVAVESPGELVVSVEVPRMTTAYREWEFEILEAGTQRTNRMKWGGPRSTGTVTGMSTIKVPLGRLALARPDTLTVRVNGLGTGADHATSRVILARPHLARMALQIVGLVVCGVGTLLSVIWGLWLLGVVKAS